MAFSEEEIKKFLSEYRRLQKEMEAAYVRYGVTEFAAIVKKGTGTLSKWRIRNWNLKPESLAECLSKVLAHEKKSTPR